MGEGSRSARMALASVLTWGVLCTPMFLYDREGVVTKDETRCSVNFTYGIPFFDPHEFRRSDSPDGSLSADVWSGDVISDDYWFRDGGRFGPRDGVVDYVLVERSSISAEPTPREYFRSTDYKAKTSLFNEGDAALAEAEKKFADKFTELCG